MIEKTAWDVRKYPEKFAVYRILCNFAVVFQNCINSMEAKYIHRELSAVIEEAYRYFSVITVTGPRQSGKTTHHPAPGGHQLAGQELDDGGLAAAGGAHQEHELPVLYLEGNSV